MREIQYGFASASAPGGKPAMFFPTSANVAPLSVLTWRFPSSVPAHTTPGITGDSEIAVSVPNDVTPSFFESCDAVPGAPIRVTLHLSMCLVRSALATQWLPWSYDLNRRLPPSQTMFALCGESWIGVFQ